MKQSVDSVTDEQLVAQFAQGNQHAFETLVARMRPVVYPYIISQVRGQYDADDIMQNTLLAAITTIRAGRYRDTGRVRLWLMRIAHNAIIDAARRRQARHIAQSYDDQDIDRIIAEQLTWDIPTPGIDPEQQRQQQQQAVRRIVDALPDNQRQVVQMRYYEDMPFRDIAQTTHVSINTALGRMHYATANMRRLARHEPQLANTN